MAITLEQHIKYSKDPILFAKERWLAIDVFDKEYKYKNITPFEFQLDCLKNIHGIKNNIIVQTRQMHTTSMIAMYIAWYVLFNQFKLVVLLSDSTKSSIRILEHVKIILQNYSVDDEKDGIVNKTYFHWEDDFVRSKKTELQLKNGCRITAIGPSPTAGRGESIDFLFIDNAAFIKDFEQIYAALGMSLCAKKDSKLIIASTPKDNSAFNKFFLNASDDGGCNPIRLHWSIHPVYSKGIIKDMDQHSPYEYSSPWFENMKNTYGGSISTIEQELECVVKYNDQNNKLKTISLRVDGDLHKKIKARPRSDESISDYIRRLIEKDLKYF